MPAIEPECAKCLPVLSQHSSNVHGRMNSQTSECEHGFKAITSRFAVRKTKS